MRENQGGARMVNKVPRETLQEKVYCSLKDSIIKNEMMPGDVLSIDSLSEELGVSPTPVREALARLSAQGLVINARNKKARVAPISEADVREIYEVRKLLEPRATELAAEEIASDQKLKGDLGKMKERAKKIRESAKEGPLDPTQYEEYLKIDISLGETVEMALENSLLNNLLAQVNDHSLRIRSFTEASSEEHVPEVVLSNTDEHLEIIERILSRDGDGVRNAVDEHLENALNRTLKALEENARR